MSPVPGSQTSEPGNHIPHQIKQDVTSYITKAPSMSGSSAFSISCMVFFLDVNYIFCVIKMIIQYGFCYMCVNFTDRCLCICVLNMYKVWAS